MTQLKKKRTNSNKAVPLTGNWQVRVRKATEQDAECASLLVDGL